ncbi:MAG: helix-turn-helix domain-containing protein, partial [Magnetococcales bacterium]|nr:helix-turn-helix domain-containing protein [Magnetococcales bacterium]
MNHKQAIPGFTQRLLSLIGDDPPYTWAIRMGIPKATMHGLLRQASPSTATLLRIAEGTDVSVTWLLTGRGPERVSGGVERWCAPEVWADSQGGDVWSGGPIAESGVWVRVDGDGMEPLLRVGDWVLVDARDAVVIRDGLYVVLMDG